MKARISRITLPPNRRIIAISDIHGRLEYLTGLLEKLRFGTEDILFLVGDFVEKGPDSLATLRYIMELCEKYTVHVSCGNCDWWYPILNADDWRMRASSVPYILRKPYCLGRQMCNELGISVSPDTDPEWLRARLMEGFPREFDFLARLPEVIDTPNYRFVHGGVPEGEPETWDAWGCLKHDDFLGHTKIQDKWTVVGHWPVVPYREDIVCANPVLDYERKIISIDGDCVLKDDGQLNALVIPHDGSFDFEVVSYDDFPTARVLQGQRENQKHWYIRWGDSLVDVLEPGEEFSRCRHRRTGYEMDILTKYIYPDGSVNDCTDYILPLSPGDIVSVVEESSRGYFVKHRGVSGWYTGELEYI